MFVEFQNLNKSIGTKVLFEGLSFKIEQNSKTALIGRNGSGKTTLLKMVVGEDDDYHGEINIKNGLKIVATKQEHLDIDTKPMDYILGEIDRYQFLKSKIHDYDSDEESKITFEEYCDFLTQFAEEGFYEIEEKILEFLAGFNIDKVKLEKNLRELSGGEKRFVELAKVAYSGADLAIFDEPTNHMDSFGKEKFINWLKQFDKSVLIITHDRDVLEIVDDIVEIKEHKAFIFPGNYQAYIRQNASSTVSGINAFETGLREATGSNDLTDILSGGGYWGEKDKPTDTAYWEYWLEAIEKVRSVKDI